MADFGTKAKPLILDFSQRAIGIVWRKLNKIETLKLSYTHTHAGTGAHTKQRFTIEDANFDIPTFNPFGTVKHIKAGGKNAEIVSPVSDAMRKNLLVWSKGYKKTETESGISEVNTIFFNVSLIAPLVPKVLKKVGPIRYTISSPAVGGDSVEPGATLYYVWLDLTPFPDPDSDLFAEEAPVFLDSIYENEAEANARAAVLNEHSLYAVYAVTEDASTTHDELKWDADISLYQDRKDFVIDDEGTLANPADKRKANETIKRHGQSGPTPEALPAERWEVTTEAIKNTITTAKS